MKARTSKPLTGKRAMEHAARLLTRWARVIKRSCTDDRGKFSDDNWGKADEADHHELTQTARELRRLAKLEDITMEPPYCPICDTKHSLRDPHDFKKKARAAPVTDTPRVASIDRAGVRPGSGARQMKSPAAATSRPAPNKPDVPAKSPAKPGTAETPAGGTAKPPRAKKRKKAKKKRASK